MDLNALSKADLLRQLSRMNERVSKLEAVLQGQAISGVKIDSITWDKAQGGIAILGGLNNVDGKLEIHDALNNLAALLDVSGLTINNGRLTIKNDSDTVSIDSKGIVSTSNFVTTETTNAALNQVFTHSFYEDATGSDANIILTRTKLIVFLLTTESYLTESVGNTADVQMGLNIDGLAPFAVQRYHSGETNLESRTTFYIASLGAGTHPVKIQGKLETIYAGSPSFTLYDFSWSSMVLGT